jgi:RNA polymerase sigma factor (sigma-70 family)
MGVTLEELAAESAWLRALAIALVRDRASADDLAQDAYLVARDRAPTGRTRRRWLARVTLNLARMRHRAATRAAARDAAAAELAPPAASPDELVARVELHRLLASLVLELAQPLRDVLLLHYVEGLSSAQIGNRLGLASGTVRWRLKQAVDELRDRLDEKRPNRAWVPALLAVGRQPARQAPIVLALVAVVAAIVVVVLRWHALVPAATPELPSSLRAAKHPTLNAVGLQALAYHEGDDDDDPVDDWRIVGVVVDGQGVPVENASVELHMGCFFGDENAAPVRSGKDGRFAVEALPGCVYWLFVEHGNRTAHVWTNTIGGESITIEISENDMVVHVVDAVTRAPVPEIRVEPAGCATRPCTPLASGRDGLVRLQRPDGVRLFAEGYASTYVDTSGMWRRPEDPPLAENMVALQPMLHVVGRVVTETGEPVNGMLLNVYTHDAMPFATTTVTDDIGRFELVAPADAWFDLPVENCWNGRRGFGGGHVEPGKETEIRVRAWCGCTPPPPQRQQQHYSPPHHYIQPPDTEMAVTVVDEHGRPVRGAEIWNFSKTMRPGRTDANGRFVFHGPGAGELYARRGERMSPLLAIDATGGHVERTIQIQPAAITGLVVDADGNPVAKAWLRVRVPFVRPMQPDHREIRTDADGHFGFVLPPGRYLISAFRETSIDDNYDAPNARVIATDTRDVTFEIP